MPENITVRRAVPADAAALELLNRAFNGDGIAPAAHIAASLASNPDEPVLIAHADNAPAGFICAQIKRSMCYNSPSAELTEMYVAPPHRRRGVASALIRALEAELTALGITEITVLTGDDNLPAQALYAATGYSPSGELHLEKEIHPKNEI